MNFLEGKVWASWSTGYQQTDPQAHYPPPPYTHHNLLENHSFFFSLWLALWLVNKKYLENYVCFYMILSRQKT